MLTRLMLASPSICAPERKKASIRPWPAQSNSSRPPSVKKLCRRLPSSETCGRPLPHSRASSAAAAGIGEAAPIATWRVSTIRPAMVAASSSSSRYAAEEPLGGTPVIDVPVEIGGEAFGRRSHAGVFGEVRRVLRIMIGEAQRPRAVGDDRDRLDVEAAERAGGEGGIVEQVAAVELLHRHHGLRRGMRHGGELAVAPDPDIAVAVGERGVE